MRRHRHLHKRYGHGRRHTRPDRKEMIHALGLEPEGHTRGDKYAYTTAEYWHDIKHRHSEAHRKARKHFGLPEPRG